MDESEQLSRLIGVIYDAALDASLWPQVLEGARAFVGGCAASFFWQDVASDSVVTYHSVGVDPAYLQLYREKYVALNPMFPATLFVEPEVVFTTGDVIPTAELQQTRFYKEWMRPQGLGDAVGANLEKNATSVAVLAVIRDERAGLVDDLARRRLRLIIPHVRRAAAIGRVIDFHKASEAAFSSVIDRLAAAVFLVDGHSRIGYANAKAQAMLGEGDVVRATHGVLRAVEASADESLRDAFLAAADGDAGIGVRGVAVILTTRPEARYVAHVLPLASRARRAAADGHVAAVFIHQVAPDRPSPLEVMAKVYKLTASEVRVLQAMMQTGGIAALASGLGISEETVKTHLKHLFAKTGVKRQADLVRLTAAHASPFEG